MHPPSISSWYSVPPADHPTHAAATFCGQYADTPYPFHADGRFFHLCPSVRHPHRTFLRSPPIPPPCPDLLGMAKRPRSRRHHSAGTPHDTTDGLYLPILICGTSYMRHASVIGTPYFPPGLVPSSATETPKCRVLSPLQGPPPSFSTAGKLTGTAPWRGRPPSGRCSR